MSGESITIFSNTHFTNLDSEAESESVSDFETEVQCRLSQSFVYKRFMTIALTLKPQFKYTILLLIAICVKHKIFAIYF